MRVVDCGVITTTTCNNSKARALTMIGLMFIYQSAYLDSMAGLMSGARAIGTASWFLRYVGSISDRTWTAASKASTAVTKQFARDNIELLLAQRMLISCISISLR